MDCTAHETDEKEEHEQLVNAVGNNNDLGLTSIECYIQAY